MLVAFSISPSTADDTGGVSEAVAAAVRVVRESGLPNETNAMFTALARARRQLSPVDLRLFRRSAAWNGKRYEVGDSRH